VTSFYNLINKAQVYVILKII